jgi:hypothetical protein
MVCSRCVINRRLPKSKTPVQRFTSVSRTRTTFCDGSRQPFPSTDVHVLLANALQFLAICSYLKMYALTLEAELAGYAEPIIDPTCLRSYTDPSERSVTNLRPRDTEDDPFWYTFKVQCTSCRETHPNPVAVNRFVSGFTRRFVQSASR